MKKYRLKYMEKWRGGQRTLPGYEGDEAVAALEGAAGAHYRQQRLRCDNRMGVGGDILWLRDDVGLPAKTKY